MSIILALSLLIPFLYPLLLNPPAEAWMSLAIIGLPLLAVQGAPIVFPKFSRVRNTIHAVILFLQCLTLGAIIIITPASAYSVWLNQAAQGAARGFVSVLFTIVPAILTWGIAGLRIHPARERLGIILAVHGLLWFSIVPGPLPILLVPAGLILFRLPLVQDAVRNFSLRILPGAAAAVAILCAIFILGTRLPAEGIGVIDDYLSFGMRDLILSLFPEFPVMYGIPEYGNSTSRDKPFQPARLSKMPLFTVTGPEGAVFYLRSTVYDYFSGDKWDIAGGIAEEFSDLIPNTGSPGTGERFLKIRVSGDYYPMLPHLLGPTGIWFSSQALTKGIHGDLATGFYLEDPLTYGDSLTFDLSETGGERILPDLPDYLYTTIPDEFMKLITSVADSIPGSGTQEIITGVEAYFRDSFTYTLHPPAYRNPVTDFLQNGKAGFCVHFASAAALILRAKGIPARFVTGYLAVLPDSDEETVTENQVTGLSAHAWVEAWTDERGWQIVEATPPLQILGAGFSNPYGQSSQWISVLDEDSRRQVYSLTGGKVNPEVHEGDRQDFGSRLIIIAILLAAAGFAVVFIILRGRHRHSGSFLSPATGQIRLVRMTRKLVLLTERLGIPHPSESGWLQWVTRVSELRELSQRPRIQDRLHDLPEAFFGTKQFTPEEISELHPLVRILRTTRRPPHVRG